MHRLLLHACGCTIYCLTGEGCPDTFPLENGKGEKILKGNGEHHVRFECNDGFADPNTKSYVEFVDIPSFPTACTCDSHTWPDPTIKCKGERMYTNKGLFHYLKCMRMQVPWSENLKI